jgi:hypothetical protein
VIKTVSPIELEILKIWLERSPAERTEADVLDFYCHLLDDKPYLLALPMAKDPYQALKVVLRNHIVQ